VPRRLQILIGLALLSGGLLGCSNDGRALAEPQPWQTTTTRPPPPTSAPPSEASKSGLALRSPDFTPGGQAPVDTTCAGRNVFPQLTWSNLPAGASEIGITLSDQTDPKNPLLLWLMAGISPTEPGLQAGTLPSGAFETLNDYGNPGYGSPCLENLAAGSRDLQFRIYALDQPSGIAPNAPGNESWDELEARATDTATLLMRVTGGSS
jgi:phosphatidylethanolamine-binding protein (PEBP) family uncharacterized protein